ncbi:MAG: ATP-binding cassette domain-containing protein [Chloroflexota bacterium]
MIEINTLSKAFGEVQAINNISFRAPDGVITGLLGPNGAGKSTTVRIISGILDPDQGNAKVDGMATHAERVEAQKRIGVLSDKRGLYQRLTSRENIRYYGRLHGLSGPSLENEIDRLIKLLDMQEIADRRTDGFSTGQLVKVAIARAMVHQPTNVILDEPMSGLDVSSTRAMRTFIRRLKDEGKTILFSSHVMQEVITLCERIVILARGEIAAEGTLSELLDRSGKDNLEDAFLSFIGSTEGLG